VINLSRLNPVITANSSAQKPHMSPLGKEQVAPNAQSRVSQGF
jgi:hypothetical protein